MSRKFLLNGVMLGALLVASVAQAAMADTESPPATDQAIIQFYGGIQPFYGGIQPFYGGIQPFYGKINPFYGGIQPFYGGIQPFYGKINPFYGGIQPFYGKINPFYGKISPFWGDTTQYWGKINPFVSTTDPFYGTVDAFWGYLKPYSRTTRSRWFSATPSWDSINAYWQSTGPEWGDINAAWAQLQTVDGADYSALQKQLEEFLGEARSLWGAAVERATHKSFMDGFAAPLMAQYGIDPSDPASLADADAMTRSAFFLAFYDGLMAYSGMPRVDWWMGAVNWSPELAQIAASNSLTTVGVLDAYFPHVNNNVGALAFIGGYREYVNDHGAEVASLIAATPVAGKAMGVAPYTQVLVYNPFDNTGTASWDDVRAGINALYARGASVINASLGVPGTVLSSEWVDILNNLQSGKANVVVVKAAGNEGITQTADIALAAGQSVPSNLIIVGSVGPDGMISAFSNRPGNACILTDGVCQEQNKLMYHFIVAPGENVLVSDNNGGTTRMSGTSFAAPLVSGAVALLQERWPWLKKYPAETAQIIFRSARDLGAPGVDPVYGWGELDIQASQSPLDMNDLYVYLPGPGAHFPGQHMPTAQLKASLLDPGQLSLWQRTGAYVVAFEGIGATYRDFEIPLSSMLVGRRINTGAGANQFQAYLYERLIEWAKTPNALSFDSRSRELGSGDWRVSLTSTAAAPDEVRRTGRTFHQDIIVFNRALGFALQLGEGSGSHALNGAGGFSLHSDFDPATGGVNPVLGFASGGVYARAEWVVGKASFSMGYTQKRDDHTFIDPTFGPVLAEALSPNRASAAILAVSYDLAPNVRLNASYTDLHEADGLFGAQGAGLFAMTQGTHTGATTVGAAWSLAGGWTLSGSATMARATAPQFDNPVLSFSSSGLTATAYEVAAGRTGLFAKADTIRVSFAQPLHVEGGAITYNSMQVVDRQTGGIGPVSETWNVNGKREYRMEALYSLPFMEGTANANVYTLVNINPHTSTSGAPELAVGGLLRFAL